MATLSFTGAPACPDRRVNTEGLAELVAARLQRLRGPFRCLFDSSAMLQEEVLARVGAVEIRRVPAGWRLETIVKGAPDAARETGLRRMASYVARRVPSDQTLHVVRPLMQTQEAPNRWRLSVPLGGMENATAALAASGGRVRVHATRRVTVAVMPVRGWPTPQRIADADARLREALTETAWISTGAAILRLHRSLGLLPLLARFQVAVPVADSAASTTLTATTR